MAAWKVGNALRSLGKTTRGVPPIFIQRAVTACVLKNPTSRPKPGGQGEDGP